ncbi:hypothetical protein LVB87_12385 [Lysobacter sp. KIS68-7]|uniref:I78 family peptidase inhibitor n=1 Tax=Lysobacter sp. KIS68-7 TaxID=2904252 RepID=UPI001E29C0E8|nr:I78 family peptidase inhibitor [Lysobacter sp. KIS68-7]UHQ18973.1 hypothetical protein LVB87_12385 [Lysobacter sp. KIS68-7]
MDKRTTLFVFLALASAGCAAAAPKAPKATCNVEGLQWAVGKPANELNFQKLYRDSGAGLWRIISPGQAVQRDKKTDRLTIYVDKQNTITRLVCE